MPKAVSQPSAPEQGGSDGHAAAGPQEGRGDGGQEAGPATQPGTMRSKQ